MPWFETDFAKVFELLNYKSNITLSIKWNQSVSVCLHIAKMHFMQCNTLYNPKPWKKKKKTILKYLKNSSQFPK